MSGTCTEPVTHESWVAYLAGDLPPDDAEAVELHMMRCSQCAAEGARVAAVTEAIRAQIPVFLPPAEVDVLRARGLAVADNPLLPGERKPVVFGGRMDILLHRLRGLDLSRAARVAVAIRAEGTGELLIATPDAPFDAASCEVLIACQRHFDAFPWNVVVEVRATHDDGREAVATYPIPHLFQPRA
jgi:anti-sigma factor RsiW